MTDTSAARGRTSDEVDRPLQPEDLPGVHRLVGGAIIAVLGPLFGFLGGSVIGADASGDTLEPLYVWLLSGIVVGGIGAVIAFLGGLRLQRTLKQRPVDPPQ